MNLIQFFLDKNCFFFVHFLDFCHNFHMFIFALNFWDFFIARKNFPLTFAFAFSLPILLFFVTDFLFFRFRLFIFIFLLDAFRKYMQNELLTYPSQISIVNICSCHKTIIDSPSSNDSKFTIRFFRLSFGFSNQKHMQGGTVPWNTKLVTQSWSITLKMRQKLCKINWELDHGNLG